MISCYATAIAGLAPRSTSVRMLAGAVLAATLAWASNASAELLAPEDNPGGQPPELSVQQWMQWSFLFNNEVDGGNPITDNTGQFQNRKQMFPVFMFGGSVAEGVTRSFKIDNGDRPLLIPLLATACVSSANFDCTAANIIDIVDSLSEDVDTLFLSVNDTILIDADTADEVDAIEDQFRITSDFFDVTVAQNNWAGEPEGVWPDSFIDGYFAFVDSLPVGEHTITVRGGRPDFRASVEATVTVPEPATLLVLLAGISGLAVAAAGTRRWAGRSGTGRTAG